jgi:hypothetical protein
LFYMIKNLSSFLCSYTKKYAFIIFLKEKGALMTLYNKSFQK